MPGKKGGGREVFEQEVLNFLRDVIAQEGNRDVSGDATYI
jgi:hypothetical protein